MSSLPSDRSRLSPGKRSSSAWCAAFSLKSLSANTLMLPMVIEPSQLRQHQSSVMSTPSVASNITSLQTPTLTHDLHNRRFI